MWRHVKCTSLVSTVVEVKAREREPRLFLKCIRLTHFVPMQKQWTTQYNVSVKEERTVLSPQLKWNSAQKVNQDFIDKITFSKMYMFLEDYATNVVLNLKRNMTWIWNVWIIQLQMTLCGNKHQIKCICHKLCK